MARPRWLGPRRVHVTVLTLALCSIALGTLRACRGSELRTVDASRYLAHLSPVSEADARAVLAAIHEQAREGNFPMICRAAGWPANCPWKPGPGVSPESREFERLFPDDPPVVQSARVFAASRCRGPAAVLQVQGFDSAGTRFRFEFLVRRDVTRELRAIDPVYWSPVQSPSWIAIYSEGCRCSGAPPNAAGDILRDICLKLRPAHASRP